MSDDAYKRYIQLGVLTLAGGAVYPLIYLRQNFEVSIVHHQANTDKDLHPPGDNILAEDHVIIVIAGQAEITELIKAND